ncbi:CapA family protein [Erythrobacter sp. HKB08]|uniref:CapA family protein n=1 Tax=Erythrobacter sp. HKB08 TaxID=2502843 RepID=UPI0010091AF3|nr:CapA family protein [Erythrobacter sp. HKB08]
MFRGPFRIRLFASLAAALALPGAASAHPAHELVGGEVAGEGELLVSGVLDGRRDRVDFSQVSVAINGVAAELSEDGHFVAHIPEDALVRLRVDGGDIFRAVQTFARPEIEHDDCACLQIPAIELVGRKKGRVELFFGGDTMAGRRYFAPKRDERVLIRPESAASDLDRLLAPMRPYIEGADVASVNLETVLADNAPGAPAPKRIVFHSTPELAPALKRAGVDFVALGNNHINDYSDAGVLATRQAVEAGGLLHAGAGLEEEEAEVAAQIDLPRNRLSMLSFVGWEGSWTPNQVATEAKGGAAFGTKGQIRRSVSAERGDGRVPIVQYHGGGEYWDRPGTTTTGRLRAAIEHGAPVAVGHHPHVAQGLEVYRGGLIAWSIGNFMFDQDFHETQSGFALKVWLDKGKFHRAEVVPLAVVDYRPVPAVGRARETALRRILSLSAERGTRFDMSGGHAVIRAKQEDRDDLCVRNTSTLLRDLAPLCAGMASARFGVEHLSRGDFESAVMGEARDRFWGASGAGLEFADEQGNRRMVLRPEVAGKPFATYPMPYLRSGEGGSFTARLLVRIPQDARIELLVKPRPEKGDAPSARWRGQSVGSIELTGGADWQQVEFHFDQPRSASGDPREFRPALRIHPAAGAGIEPVAIDDFSLVEWHDGVEPGSKADWRFSAIRRNSSLAESSYGER